MEILDLLKPEAAPEITPEDSFAASQILTTREWATIESILTWALRVQVNLYLQTQGTVRDYAFRQGYLLGYKDAVELMYTIKDYQIQRSQQETSFPAETGAI